MKLFRFVSHVSAGVVLLLVANTLASAQATRTWVSGVGDDANPCSRTAPCKTFAGAISKTAAGGEIDCLDPGGFGAVTITKSITIDGTGITGGILNAGTNGVVVNALATDIVTLRNVSIQGVKTGLNGINFLNGGVLNLEGVVISGNTQKGLNFAPGMNSKLFVKDSIIRGNKDPVNGGGIKLSPAATFSVTASLDNVRLEDNQFGLFADDRVKVAISNSVLSGNAGQGLIAAGTVGPVDVNLENTVISNNGSFGIRNANTSATSIIRMSNVNVFGNATGVSANGASVIRSFLNNRIDGNTTDGAPTTTKAQQ